MSTSDTGSFLGSKAPWPPATITVRERRSPLSVCSTTRSSSHEIDSAVVSRWTGTSNCSSVCLRCSSTRSLARIRGWPGTSKIHFSGYSVVSWPPSSGSESMMRADASRMPAQKAADRPTGPAPITVMSRTCSRSWSRVVVMGSGEGLKGRDGLAVEGAERALQRDAQAGEAGSVAQRVGRRLRGAQALHDPVTLVGRDRVPRARLDERVDEQVSAAERARHQAFVLRVLRALADAQEGVG